MMKKTVLYAVVLTLAVGFGSSAMAADKGPADITLQATKDAAAKPKPAAFPHAKHQATMACGDCHHGKDAAGKQEAYKEGQKIEKCETCHNSAAGLANKDVATYKDAAHKNCKGCHTEKKAGPTKCDGCHK
jgi:hypothetical protein